jgi:ribosomal protein S5
MLGIAEAIRLSREVLHQRADFVGVHRVLTVSLGMSGETEAAKAALEALRRVQALCFTGLAR